jgi:hypothetical protein
MKFTPNPSFIFSKQKTKLKFLFRAIPIAIGIKVKHAHNTAYLVTAFIQKPPPIFASATLRQTSDMPKRYMQCSQTSIINK